VTEFECRICPFSTTSPLGIQGHSRKHRNEFESVAGRRPRNYDEVRALLVDGDAPADVDVSPGRVSTLDEFTSMEGCSR
jgi:hypothetical protein